MEKHDIVGTTRAAGSLTTLLAAVEAAGLEPTLRSDGPFTVFAPTDEAFSQLPDGTVESLLADRAKLTQVLTYHVVPGRMTAAEAAGRESAPTVHGDLLPLSVDGGLRAGDSRVVSADIEATNGLIHVIDRVLLPAPRSPKGSSKVNSIRTTLALLAVTAVGVAALGTSASASAGTREQGNIVQTAVAAGKFKTLASLLEKAGLADTLATGGPFTVFAPTDAAFAKVPKATLAALAKDAARLRSVLLYHVVKGKVTAGKVVKLRSAKTLNGQAIAIRVSGGKVTIGGARVTTADIAASNGVIHVIDKVLIPR
jgi:transforming growth factor-beta-induced protein